MSERDGGYEESEGSITFEGEAGQGLDARVALAIGWEVRETYYRSDGEYAGLLVYEKPGCDGGCGDGCGKHCRGAPGHGWSPSTKIAQAWEVAEKLAAHPTNWHFMVGPDGSVSAQNGGDSFDIYADTAPLAICLATLRAVTPTPDSPNPEATP